MVMRLIDLGHDEDDGNNEGQDRKRRNNRTCIGSSPITDVAVFGLRRDRRFEEGAKLSWLVGLLRMIGFRPFRRNFDRGRAGASRAGFRGFRDGVRIDGGMYLLAPGRRLSANCWFRRWCFGGDWCGQFWFRGWRRWLGLTCQFAGSFGFLLQADSSDLGFEAVEDLESDVGPGAFALSVVDERLGAGDHLAVGEEGVFDPVAGLDEDGDYDEAVLAGALKDARHFLGADELRVEEALADEEQGYGGFVDFRFDEDAELIAADEFFVEPEVGTVDQEGVAEKGDYLKSVVRVEPFFVFAGIADEDAHRKWIVVRGQAGLPRSVGFKKTGKSG